MTLHPSEIRHVLVSTALTAEECPASVLGDIIREHLQELFGNRRPSCVVQRWYEEDGETDECRRAFLLRIRKANAVDMQTIVAALADYAELSVDDAEYEPDEEDDAPDLCGQFSIPELDGWRGIPPEDEPEDWGIPDEIDI